MTSRPAQNFYAGDQSAGNKMDEVFNSDEESRGGNGYDAGSYEQFISAIKNGNLALYNDILNAHPEYSLRIDPFSGQTPIFEIVQLPDENIIIEMLKAQKAKDADLNFKDKLKQNIVFYIARDGKIQTVNYIASEGVSLNEADAHSQTPLYYAAREGHPPMCKRLIELGLNPNHNDIVKQTCLFYAAKAGHLETCKLLVENGARHEHTDKKKQTALFWAKKSGNKELIDYLESLKNIKTPKEKPASSETKSSKKKRSKEDQKFVYNLVYTDENGHKIQMTKEGFQKFLEEYPQLAGYFQNPEKLQVDSSETRESWEKIAKKIVQAMWKMRGAFHFHQPVDPVRLNCHDYFDIVKNPMDFGTVKNKLNSNLYENCATFASDMKAVFSNCILYNGAESEIGIIGQTLEKDFDRLSHDYGLDQYLQDDYRSEMRDESEEQGEGEGEGEGEEHGESPSQHEDRDNLGTVEPIEEEKQEEDADEGGEVNETNIQSNEMQEEEHHQNIEENVPAASEGVEAGQGESHKASFDQPNVETNEEITNVAATEDNDKIPSQIPEEIQGTDSQDKAENEAPEHAEAQQVQSEIQENVTEPVKETEVENQPETHEERTEVAPAESKPDADQQTGEAMQIETTAQEETQETQQREQQENEQQRDVIENVEQGPNESNEPNKEAEERMHEEVPRENVGDDQQGNTEVPQAETGENVDNRLEEEVAPAENKEAEPQATEAQITEAQTTEVQITEAQATEAENNKIEEERLPEEEKQEIQENKEAENQPVEAVEEAQQNTNPTADVNTEDQQVQEPTQEIEEKKDETLNENVTDSAPENLVAENDQQKSIDEPAKVDEENSKPLEGESK